MQNSHIRHYSLRQQLALQAIRDANVRFGIVPTQSREGGVFNSRIPGHPATLTLYRLGEAKTLDSRLRGNDGKNRGTRHG